MGRFLPLDASRFHCYLHNGLMFGFFLWLVFPTLPDPSFRLGVSLESECLDGKLLQKASYGNLEASPVPDFSLSLYLFTEAMHCSFKANTGCLKSCELIVAGTTLLDGVVICGFFFGSAAATASRELKGEIVF